MWRGKPVRESTKQGNDKVARQMEAAHRTSLAKGEVGLRDRKPAPTLAHFISGRVEPWAKARSSWLWFRAGIRPLVQYKPIAATKLDEICSATADDYAAHRQSQGLQVSTVNRELRVLRRILRLAMEWGLVERAPKVAMCGKETYRERVVNDDELERYLLYASPLLSDVATVLNDTGLRPDECHRLDWSDFTFTNGRQGKVLVRYGKTAAARRELPLTPRVRALLEARWETAGRPAEGWIWPAPTKTGHIDHSSLKKQHRTALRLSGVRPFVIYSLRHTFATRIAPHVDAWTLCKVMGWSSLSVAMRYIHPSEDRVLSAFSSLGGHKNGHTASHGLLNKGGNSGQSTENPRG
jgi:integrase